MVLTRNLYRLDEVQAAFLYSLKRRSKDAYIWLHELEESGYPSDARSLLLLGWVMRVGWTRISWIGEWAEKSTTVKGRRELCTLLQSISTRDTSVLWLVWYGATEEEPAMNLEKALEKKNLCIAWWWLSRSNIWDTIRNKSCSYENWFDALEHGLGTYSIFGKAIAYMLVHAPVAPTSLSPISFSEHKEEKELNETLEKLSLTNSPLKRLLAIPWECLFGMTSRGCGQDTQAELRSLELSGIWKQLAEPFQENGSWRDDAAFEEFCNTYFPIELDIPDEWSKEEFDKSHGQPILNCKGADFARWWRNWVYPERLFVWKETANVQQWLSDYEINLNETVFETLNKLYETDQK